MKQDFIKKYFKDILIISFILGGYAMQFTYMMTQISSLSIKVDILQDQVASQGQQLIYMNDSFKWLRERIS
ncbi:MAG: hypothetical protein M1308_14050 [Actinobacteria bacterium]|nr:hypothetical protein [Actinomycetota bacterium]